MLNASEMTKKLRAAGRPPEYDPSYVDEVPKALFASQTMAHLAAHLRVSVQTIIRWRAKYPEFEEAVGAALAACEAWWWDIGTEAMTSGIPFNFNLYGHRMRNQFGCTMRDPVINNNLTLQSVDGQRDITLDSIINAASRIRQEREVEGIFSTVESK